MTATTTGTVIAADFTAGRQGRRRLGTGLPGAAARIALAEMPAAFQALAAESGLFAAEMAALRAQAADCAAEAAQLAGLVGRFDPAALLGEARALADLARG
ncbi:MAG TPA: hypothetical protein VEH84_04310 [Alphaproteobacteria bacterium]|nr:hypothetical protein [Alphaproteobacteria bacterium]